MLSNTKLTDYQKNCLRKLRTFQNTEFVSNGETTIAYRELGNTFEFSTAIMSQDERKFRPKVGEFYARDRFDNGFTVKMGRYDFMYMLETVFGIEVKL